VRRGEPLIAFIGEKEDIYVTPTLSAAGAVMGEGEGGKKHFDHTYFVKRKRVEGVPREATEKRNKKSGGREKGMRLLTGAGCSGGRKMLLFEEEKGLGKRKRGRREYYTKQRKGGKLFSLCPSQEEACLPWRRGKEKKKNQRRRRKGRGLPAEDKD